jgi:hypothetical protein
VGDIEDSMRLPYYPYTSAQWNAVAVALKDAADDLRRLPGMEDMVQQIDANVTDALERAKVAYEREKTVHPAQFLGGGK